MARPEGTPWLAFEDRIRETVTDYVGVRRSEKGLRLALDTLSALAKREGDLSAENLHGVMRVHEARNIRLNVEIMATAALARQETRTRSSHRRLDFPAPDNENWRKFLLVEKGSDERPSVRTVDTSEALASAFARKSPDSAQRTVA